jgi:dihydroorotate dehydrogenase
MTMLYRLARPALFALPPETAHRVTLRALRCAHGLRLLPTPRTVDAPVELMGLRFPNRLGIAAGLDKDGRCIDALGALGVGCIEVGTVTPRAQPGQDRPRLFRLPRARALINRMGFPNAGVDALRERLARRTFRGICGVNIGKNRDTPLERAFDDYVFCARAVVGVADYVVLNVSSPNTPGLRGLQDIDHLGPIIAAVSAELGTTPLLVKVSPDLEPAALDALASLIRESPVAGVIATNTTVLRPDGLGRHAREDGGLSGEPLKPLAIASVRALRTLLGPSRVVVGVGGIASAGDAAAMLAAGADLVQIYTGLVYRGPALISDCVSGSFVSERGQGC